MGETDDPFSGYSPNTLESCDLDHIERNEQHFEEVDLSEYVNEDGFGTVGIL